MTQIRDSCSSVNQEFVADLDRLDESDLDRTALAAGGRAER
jgi:hypothetical protein